ncbi:phage major capsid protein [Frankia sp. Cj3]|uniref:phage major capsid protein n=1 Tax=Frankia sp. Cj3 TaxID=2880976 RepID=UPI001EF65370|nr:phage major capsid protein [Frankia sp. Cj3]
MKLDEILAEQAVIRADLKRLEEDPNTTEEDSGDLRDTLVARWEELDERTKPIIARMEKLKLIEKSGENPANGERPFGNPDLVTRNNRDPFADLQRVEQRLVQRGELRERALDAIERANKAGDLEHDYAEEATRRAQADSGIARHVLLTGSEQYREAFRAYLTDPEGEVRRTALSLTVANGGYLLPYILDPTIVLTNAGSANPYRRISNVKQTTSNAWQGVSSAGVTAAWLAEGVAAADASPTVGQIQITPVKGSAWVFGSFEVLQDTNFGEQLPRLLGDAKDRLEESAFAVGTGTAQPLGVLSALGTGQKVAAVLGTGGAFNGTGGTGAPQLDVYNTMASLPARFRQSDRTAWIANITNITRIRGIDQYGGSSFWANFGQDQPEQLLGKSIYESTSITTTAATGTGTGSAALLFGDFNEFYIVDRVGTSMIYDPLVKGTGANANVPTGQSGWYYYWRTSSGVSTANAFRWLANGS